MIAGRRDNLYYIQDESVCAGAAQTSLPCSDLWSWHERLGHLNSKNLVTVICDLRLPPPTTEEAEDSKKCEVCLRGKMTALPFPKGRPPCTEVLKIVHTDVVGPLRV